jgi:hypothetical protein
MGRLCPISLWDDSPGTVSLSGKTQSAVIRTLWIGLGQSGWFFASDNVFRGRPPRVPVVAIGFDERLVANPDRPRLGILPPPSARYRDLDKCCRVGSQPFLLQPLVRCIPFIAVELAAVCRDPHPLIGRPSDKWGGTRANATARPAPASAAA